MTAMLIDVTGSSNIAAYGYNPATQSLVVRYKNGGLYHYEQVPSNVVRALNAAPSKGKFINAEIKNAGYAWQMIADDELAVIFGNTNPPSVRERRSLTDALKARYCFLRYAF